MNTSPNTNTHKSRLPHGPRLGAFALLIFVCIIAVAPRSFAALSENEIRSRIKQGTSCFDDITLESRIVTSNMKELRKIGKDFANSYEFKTVTIRYKNPYKMRADSKLGMVGFSMIIDGNEKGFRIPIRGWVKENIREDPHKRQTEFDLGIITDSLWRDYVVQDARVENSGDDAMYKIVFAWSNSLKKKRICWVDADDLKLLKLQTFESDGRPIATYVYSNHKRVSGIWVPSRIDVYSRDKKLAGTTLYEKVKINTGIPDSAFRW